MSKNLKYLSDLNSKMMGDLLSKDTQAQAKQSLRVGQRIVLKYPLSQEIKKQVDGIIVKITNRNLPCAAIHVICGETLNNRFIKVIRLYNRVEIMNAFPLKKAKRADITYLMHVNSFKKYVR